MHLDVARFLAGLDMKALRTAALSLCVAAANAQNLMGQMVARWQTGTQAAPATFSEWKGTFHDGSGPFGTYANNQDSWYLIDPCARETAEGRPCRVLMWFGLFDSEGIYDTLTVFDGSDSTRKGSQLALLSGGAVIPSPKSH